MLWLQLLQSVGVLTGILVKKLSVNAKKLLKMKTGTKIIIALLSIIVFAEFAYYFAWQQKLKTLEAQYKS